MSQQQIVAVAGATGFVGRAVVRELLDRGWSVRALVREPRKAAASLPRNDLLTLVIGDSTKSSALVAGASACVNAVGLLRETSGGQTFKRVHVENTRDLVEACRSAGVTRFVQVSALGVSAAGKTPYQQTKYQAEQLVRRSGLEWTILRPALIHGRDSGFVTLAKGWVTGAKQPWFFLPYFSRGVLTSDLPLAAIRREAATVAPVAVEDVAWAVGESLARPDAVGEIFNLCGPEELTWPTLLRTIRDSVPGANPELEPLGIPAESAAIQARAADILGIGGLLPFDQGMATMGASDSTASLDKARAILGFNPRPFTPTLRGYAAAIA